MRDVYRSLNPWSCALVGINNTSKSCPAFPNIAAGLQSASYWYFARHCCWHRNFQLSSGGFYYELEFFVVWFHEVYSSRLSGSVEFLFLALFCLLLCCIRHTSSGREVSCFLVSLSQDHVYPSSGLSFNKMNLVKACPCIHPIILFLHTRSNNLQYVSPSLHPAMYESFW